MIRLRRAVEEVPRGQPALLALDDQEALAREDEEAFLAALAVVQRQGLSGPEHIDVDPEPREAALALEVAVDAELPGVTPADLAGVDDEPSGAPGPEAELRALERRLGNHGP